MGENERGKVQQNIPENSHYVKSEDIMYMVEKKEMSDNFYYKKLNDDYKINYTKITKLL